MKRYLARTLLTIALVGSASGLAVPANAAVWGCSSGFSSAGAWSKCLSGNGNKTYRTAVLCQNIFTRASRNAYGQWVTIDSADASVVPGCGNWYEVFYGSPRATSGQ